MKKMQKMGTGYKVGIRWYFPKSRFILDEIVRFAEDIVSTAEEATSALCRCKLNGLCQSMITTSIKCDEGMSFSPIYHRYTDPSSSPCCNWLRLLNSFHDDLQAQAIRLS